MSAPDPPDIERLRAAFASLADQPGWPPADAERLFTALHGDMSADERRAVIEELARYPDAAAVWRLARELTPEKATANATMNANANVVAIADALAASARRRRYTRTWLSIAAAALVLITAGGLWQLQSTRQTDTPAYRSAASAIASQLPAGRPLSRANPVLRWTPIADARYHVRVLTPSLDLLDEADEIREPAYRLRDEVLRRIPSGGEILWQVEAIVPGRASAASPTFSVRVE
jgi:hypothetical protein